MKKYALCLLVAVLCVAVAAPAVIAAEKTPAKSTEKKGQPAANGQVKQGELAHLLVQALGLSRFLPASPSDQQCYAILMDNGISPAKGWNSGEIVIKADLARVIVQAMKKQSEIKNPNDAKEWIDYLKSIGVPLETVGETVDYVEPMAEPVAVNVVGGHIDPLVKRHKFNPTDEMQYGVDMAVIVRILSQFEFSNGEFRPKPVTPD